MRIMLAIVLAGLIAPVTSAQQSETAVAEASVISVLDSANADSTVIQPVAFVQSGSSTRVAVPQATAGSGSRVIVEPSLGGSSTRSGVVTGPSSVISGEVITSEPVYGESVAVVEGSADCGCGAPAPAPVVTYSSAPACPEPVPAADPCSPPKRRGFFRSLFGN